MSSFYFPFFFSVHYLINLAYVLTYIHRFLFYTHIQHRRSFITACHSGISSLCRPTVHISYPPPPLLLFVTAFSPSLHFYSSIRLSAPKNRCTSTHTRQKTIRARTVALLNLPSIYCCHTLCLRCEPYIFICTLNRQKRSIFSFNLMYLLIYRLSQLII